MPLTPEEQKELEALERELEQPEQENVSLTPEEEAELAELESQFSPKPEPEKEDTSIASKAKSTAAGIAQGATLGWFDEGLAAANTGLDMAIDAMLRPFQPEQVQAIMEKPEFKTAYRKEVNRIRNNFDKLQKNNPKLFMAGEISGGMASALVPGGLAAKGVSGMSKVVKTLATATGTGAATGAGMSTEKELGKIAKDAAKGAMVGAAVGGLGAGLTKLGKGIITASDNIQMKALGPAGRVSPEKQKELVKFARDNGILVTSPEQTLINASKVRQKALDSLIDVKDKLKDQDFFFVDQNKLLKDFDEIIKKVDFPDTKADAQLAKQIREAVEEIDPSNYEEVQQLYSRIGKHTRNRSASDFTKQTTKSMYAAMSDNIDEGLNQLGKEISEPALKDTFRAVRKQFATAQKIADIAEQEAYRVQPGLRISPADYYAAIVGSPGRAALQVGAKTALRRSGPAMLAKQQKAAEPAIELASKAAQGLSKARAKQGATVGLLELLRNKNTQEK